MTDLDICVCTYRRPQLQDTLASLGDLNLPDDIVVNILVVDNDDEPTARGVVGVFALTSPIPVRYVHCPQGNISIARNGALTHSAARYLAFVDDDETVTPEWLVRLLDVMKRDNAQVVLGPVDPVYASNAPAWMQRLGMHQTRPVWVNGEITTGYTCNVLIDRQSEAVRDREFDLTLGQTGGEDTAFFTAIFKAGGRISYAEHALVREAVPQSRANIAWLLRRRFRMGQTHGRLIGCQVGALGRLRHLGVVIAKIIYCASLAFIQLFRTAARNHTILRGTLHVGAASGLMGFRELRQYGPDAEQKLQN